MIIPVAIIILFFLISFLVYTMPMILVKFNKSLKGKFLLIVLTIIITLYNPLGGILMAMLIIFLEEFNYEFNSGILYEGFAGLDKDEDDDTEDEDDDIATVNDQLTIDENLKRSNI
jgi:hypothetical protein